MIVISNIYIICIFINLNPFYTNLKQRADFLSLSRVKININEENSELIYGSEIEGSIATSIKIPKEYDSKEFDLRIEADTKRIWNHTSISSEKEYSPSKDLRFELLINGEIEKIYSYSTIPEHYYSSNIYYCNLKITHQGRRISFCEKITSAFSIKKIVIRLVTNHSLRADKNIFSDYFHNEEYSLTICIGDPDLIFYISSIFLFLNYWIFIIVIFLRRLILN